MGEVRGEEGRDLFQVMSTGHTAYSTFHADTVGEVIKRFTTEPINVSKTLFTALDLVSIQTQTRVNGNKVRRNKNLTEINEYSAEHDEINVRDVYEWQAETDEYLQMGNSNTLEELKFDRGWKQERLDEELFKRKAVLAYLIEQNLNTYTEVAATVQAFINDPDTIIALIAEGKLDRSLDDLREMESVSIDIDPDKEEMVPRPDPPGEMLDEARGILENAEPLFERFREKETTDIVSALTGVEEEEEITPLESPEAQEGDDEDIDFSEFVPAAGAEADEA
jgi:flagellar protein FlaI